MLRATLPRVVVVAVGLVLAVAAVAWILGAQQGRNSASATPNPAATAGVAAGDVPGADLVGLPRYPGSVRVAYQQRVESANGLMLSDVEYVAWAELDAVREFYRAVFQSGGWTVVDVRFSQERWTFFVVQGGREAHVRLEARGTVVGIVIGLSEPDLGGGASPAWAAPNQAPVGGSNR